MNIHLATSVGLLIGLAGAGLLINSYIDKRSADLDGNQSAIPLRPRPFQSISPRPVDPLADEVPGFSDLPPDLQALVRKIYDERSQWNEDRPLLEPFFAQRRALDEFSDLQLAEVGIEQIRMLGEWNAAQHYGRMLSSRPAIFRAWGMREPAQAHAAILVAAGSHRYNAEIVSDLFHYVLVGHARVDPEGAWRQYLDDTADPLVSVALGYNSIAEAIFKEWARLDPEQALLALFEHPVEGQFWELADSFALGSPKGQDWLGLAEKIEAEATKRGYEFASPGAKALAVRWLAEDPIPALDWYADRISELRIHTKRNDSDYDPGEIDSLLAEDPDQLIGTRTEMKSLLFSSLGSDSFPDVIRRINHEGESKLAARIIANHLRSGNDRDFRIISLIPEIGNRAEQERLLLEVTPHLPVPSALEHLNADPNSYEVLIQSAMARINPSPESVDAINSLLNDYQVRVNKAFENWNPDPFAPDQ